MPDADYRLDNQWAVVTGSTHGIGRAIAMELAAAGANVVVHGRDQVAADEVCSAIRNLNREAEAVVIDLSLAGAAERLVNAVWTTRPIDAWINNAGADVITGAAGDWSFDKKLQQLWDVDVRSTIDCGRTVGGLMRERGQGSIVNIGWDQAATGMEGDSGELFTATKGAIMAFTRSLARSLAPWVRVNCVAPGWIRTDWGEIASEYWQQRAQRESLLRRWGEPADVAHVVRFLVSSASSFVNGQVIDLNGGRAGGVVDHAAWDE